MRWSSSSWAFAVAFVAPSAFAQQTQLVAQFKPLAPDAMGDSAPLSGAALAAPLRLSLQNSVVRIGGAFAGCATHDEPSGNSVGGVPLAFQHAVRVTPALTLSTFSSLGCPIDASAGALAAVTLPLTRSLTLVIGAGVILAPGQLPLHGSVQNAMTRSLLGQDSAVNVAAKADLVWRTKGGRTFSVGVGSVGKGRGVSFGGGF